MNVNEDQNVDIDFCATFTNLASLFLLLSPPTFVNFLIPNEIGKVPLGKYSKKDRES